MVWGHQPRNLREVLRSRAQFPQGVSVVIETFVNFRQRICWNFILACINLFIFLICLICLLCTAYISFYGNNHNLMNERCFHMSVLTNASFGFLIIFYVECLCSSMHVWNVSGADEYYGTSNVFMIVLWYARIDMDWAFFSRKCYDKNKLFLGHVPRPFSWFIRQEKAHVMVFLIFRSRK